MVIVLASRRGMVERVASPYTSVVHSLHPFLWAVLRGDGRLRRSFLLTPLLSAKYRVMSSSSSIFLDIQHIISDNKL
jgi:hypothetical protein